MKGTIYALLAAAFYALGIPVSKRLLSSIEPLTMAALLYLGAGLGTAIIYLGLKATRRKATTYTKLEARDLPYIVGMVVLDILAPICLMLGLKYTPASSAALLNNFEVVSTALIAYSIFKEAISKTLFIAIVLATIASIELSVDKGTILSLHWPSLLILLASILWGLENNCTNCLSSKDTLKIVIIKGLSCAIGSLILARVKGEALPRSIAPLLQAILTGFIAYGLSIFYYIRSQHILGAARTSAYYALSPFIATASSIVLLKEPLSLQYLIALLLMLIAQGLIIKDSTACPHKP